MRLWILELDLAVCLAVIFKLFSSFLSPMHIKFMPRLWIAFRHSAIPEVCARDANDFIWVCDEIRSPEAESRVCDYSVLTACHESQIICGVAFIVIAHEDKFGFLA